MFLPGLGQLYNQEPRKATFFMAAGAVNYLFVLTLLLMAPLMQVLKSFGESNQVRLNGALANSLTEMHAGSGAFFILLALFLSFALFAARDAYDKAQFLQRKSLYHDHVIGMPEAASGSYLFHISLFISCFILAFFFLIPPLPKEQMTVIEFKESTENVKENLKAKKYSDHASRAGGKHDPQRQTAVAHHAAESNRQTKAVAKANSKSEAEQKSKPQSKAGPKADNVPPRPERVMQQINKPTAADLPMPMPKPMPKPAPVKLPAQLPLPLASVSPVLLTAPNPSISHSSAQMSAPGPLAPPPVMPSPLMANLPVGVAHPVITASGASALVMPKANIGSSGSTGGSSPPANSGSAGPVKIASALPAASSPVPVPLGSRSSSGSEADHGSSSAPAPSRATAPPGQGARGSGVVGPVLRQGGHNQAANFDQGKNKDGTEASVVDFSAYMAALQARIKRNWFPPRLGRSKRVKVIFNIARDGQLSKLRLLNSSGLTDSDNAALKAVEAAAPLMPLPKGAPVDVDIEFTFDYNVFNGGGAGT